MVTEQAQVDAFDGFVRRHESRLREALTASLGIDRGRDATAEAFAYAWEHWDKVRRMDNPAGYLYILGRNRGRRWAARKRMALPPVSRDTMPWIEPDLPGALAALPEQQRIVVMLLYCFQWTMAEAADFLDVSKSTVQTHADRGLERLRRTLGVPS